MHRVFVAPDFANYPADWHFSPVLDTGSFVFLSGITGVRPDQTVAADPETQFHDAFRFVEQHLAAAGLTINQVVDLTSYHVGLRQYLPQFAKIKDVYIRAPYPAWTAIGVVELITPGTLVEMRVIAKRD